MQRGSYLGSRPCLLWPYATPVIVVLHARDLQPAKTSARISRRQDGNLIVSKLWHCENVCICRV